MTPFGLFFTSSESPQFGGTGRCSPETVQDFSCTGFWATVRVAPGSYLPTFPLLQSLLEDTNSALSKFEEIQIVYGFLPVLGRRQWRYYRISSSSFPRPFTVPPGLASITLERVSESQKHSVSLSHSEVSSLETMLFSV